MSGLKDFNPNSNSDGDDDLNPEDIDGIQTCFTREQAQTCIEALYPIVERLNKFGNFPKPIPDFDEFERVAFRGIERMEADPSVSAEHLKMRYSIMVSTISRMLADAFEVMARMIALSEALGSDDLKNAAISTIQNSAFEQHSVFLTEDEINTTLNEIDPAMMNAAKVIYGIEQSNRASA